MCLVYFTVYCIYLVTVTSRIKMSHEYMIIFLIAFHCHTLFVVLGSYSKPVSKWPIFFNFVLFQKDTGPHLLICAWKCSYPTQKILQM